MSQTSGPIRPGSGGSDLSEDLLSAYVDGELDDATRSAVETRLAESDEWRTVLDDVTAARDAIRSLPLRDAPPEFWERILSSDDTGSDDTASESPEAASVADLDAARARRRSTTVRFAAFAASAAAAIVIVAVALVPGTERVRPSVATFTNAHAVRSSVGNDVVSNVAGEAVPGGIGR